ncbi:helix-turn-helix domain-containing protein [Mycobacteroides salmoniphilum]|uniref:helix-turn-helix domain-containing protein n=1 Tax=Mycobacteroides salmoniphilum TaxID=404941 RepID=UPI0009923F24
MVWVLCESCCMTISTDYAPVPVWDMADRLAKSLRMARMTKLEMADYLEVHRNTVSAWLNGKSEPKRPQLIAWALRTGLPYEWIKDGTDSTQGGGPDGGGSCPGESNPRPIHYE